MKVKFVGKVRRKGVSKKNGRDYDFTEVHYTAPARGVTGEAALTLTVGPEIFPYESISPGLYDVEFDYRGTVLAVAPLQTTPSK